MKQLIAELPTLTVPMEKDELIVYLEAAQEAVSIVLMTEREAKQMHIQLSSSRTNQSSKCCPDQKLQEDYKNFIVEHLEDGSPDTPIEVEEKLSDPWTLFTDGSSCVDGSRAGLIFTDPEGVEFTYALRFRFDATNNETEYEALISGISIAEQIGVKNLQVSVDSHLVANQVNGSYIAKELVMVEKVKMVSDNFKKFSIKQVPRSENKKADALSKNASTSFPHLTKHVLVKELCEKSIYVAKVLAVVEEERDTWMTQSIITSLKKYSLRKRKRQERCDANNPFKDWCEKLCIRQRFASVKHPQANGLVERVNRSLREGIKARVEARSKNWMEEISHVLWAHRTMIKSRNGDTLFSLTYGTEAVIPAEIGMPTLRTAKVDVV
ncbi:reverse transcriptase domain-containing protein [Tanacetum coccineum]